MEDRFNIMGIDPGSRTIGVCIFEVVPRLDKDILEFDIDKILTFNLAIDLESNKGIHDVLLDRTNRIAKIIQSLYALYEPSMVGIETSFINLSRMSAVIPLSRAIQSIETAIYTYDSYAKVLNMTPGVIKKMFGSKQVGKEAVLDALKDKPDLVKKVEISRMSDHEVDGIAIAYGLLEYIKTNRGMLCIKYLEIS